MHARIKKHFERVDPILFAVIAKVPPVTASASDDYFYSLSEAIINQQLSGKAGDTIWKRFLTLFPKGKLTPERVLVLPDAKIRAIGTSWSKITYLKSLATYVKENKLHLTKLKDMIDEEVIRELTQVKGIGPWTAEMFLMFTLGREDVFSYGDLGLKNAIKKLYKFKKDPTRKQMEKLAENWSPYRTWAARILWRSLDIQ